MISEQVGGVDKSAEISVEGALTIPGNVLISNSEHCNVIKVAYDFIVDAMSTSCHGDIVFVVPITIGTVPLIIGENEEGDIDEDDEDDEIDSEKTLNDTEQTSQWNGNNNGSSNGGNGMYPMMPDLRNFLCPGY